MKKTYVVIKPFPNSAGRMLPIGNVGAWGEADVKGLVKDGNLEEYNTEKHGGLLGAFAENLMKKVKAPFVKPKEVKKESK